MTNYKQVRFKIISALTLLSLLMLTFGSLICVADIIQQKLGEMLKEEREELDKGKSAVATAQSEYDKCKKSNKNCESESSKLLDAKADLKALQKRLGREDSRSGNCEDKVSEYNEKYKECQPIVDRLGSKCVTSSKSELIDNDSLSTVTPFMSGIPAADTMLGVYEAMNLNPVCNASKSEYTEEKRDMRDQAKDIEDKLKNNRNDAQDAQEKFADKMKDWSEKEKKISDRLTDIPAEREQKLDDIDKEKLNKKAQLDSKYSSITDAMLELKKKYGELVDNQALSMEDTSEFAMHDRCLRGLEGKDDKSGKGGGVQVIPTKTTTGDFAGAFLLGKTANKYKQQLYDNCMAKERKNAVRISNSIVRELNSIKTKLESMDGMLGQVQEEKGRLDSDAAKQIARLQTSLDNEVKKLSVEYQQIQQDKVTQKALLDKKLKDLENDTKTQQQKLVVLNMKLSRFKDKTVPPSSDKSVMTSIGECRSVNSFMDNFKSQCCDNDYDGKGKYLCKQFEADKKKFQKIYEIQNK
jgi:chromosome segregation ATPase